MADDQAAASKRSQESLDYNTKREFRSDQSEGRLSLNDTLQSECGSEGGQVSEGSSEQRKRSRSRLSKWNKRTGAQIYHMTENVGERGRDVIKRVKRSVSRPRSMPVPSTENADVDDTEDITAEETNVMNISMDGSVASKKSKKSFKQWDKKTGAKIHRLTESVGDRGRDVIKSVRKNISRPASVASDMDANKDDKVSTVSKMSESSQERRKKSKFQEWNKKTGAQMHHITGSATERVRSGITTVANSPPVEAATERGRVLVRQATATLKSRTASMPRGASAPGADGDVNYSATLPRNRGASSSPSRGGTLKRLSANLPPLPQQLRKVFPGRDSAQQPRDPSPSKPSRRQGPVGKNWVKVYDDISYVDDRDKNHEGDYPALGHRVGPTVLPNAKALPTPPTPPPPRARHANKPALDINVDDEIANYGLDSGRGRNNNRFKGRREKRTGTPMGRDTGFNDEFEDEGDALRRSARLEAPQGADEDDYIIPETLMPAKPVRGIKVYEDVIFKRKQQEEQKVLATQTIVGNELEIEAPKQQEQDMQRQQNIIEAQIIVADEIEIDEPKKPQRGVKVYEDVIFKRKQENEKQLLDENKISQEQELARQIEDAPINTDEVLPPVQKPQRGIKVYEGINFKQQQEKQKQIQEENKSQETIKDSNVVEDKPAKPQRGIKIYDKIEFKSVQYTFETDMAESVLEVTIDEPSTSSEVTVIDGSLKDDVPSKPERGNKVYGSLLVQRHESSGQVLVTDLTQAQSKPKPTEPVSPRLDELKIELQNSHLSLFEAPALEVARMDVVKAHEATVEAQVVENSIPATPKVEAQPKMENKDKSEKRTEKAKVTVVLEDVCKVEILKTKEETPQVEVTTKVADTVEISKNINKTNDIEIEIINPEIEMEIPDGSIPPYARVHKETGGVGPLRSLTPADSGDEDGPPPPIPPKKVGIRTITPTASFDLPPRPSRHLKPSHLKPVRGNKPRRPQINGELLPSRPQRGTKLYADVEPAKPKRHSKVIRIEDVALMKEDLQELSMPSKPSRQRRRSEKENVLEYEDVPEAVTARLTVALDHPAPLEISTDFYENVELKDGAPIQPGRSRMRGRPPPPPPPKKGNIQKNYLDRNGDQSSQPTDNVDSSGSDSVVAQELSTTDSISTPDEVCTTTTLTTTTGSSSQLETDIDHNLKNIESSFATLDDVLQSLKSYSRESSRNRRVILGESEKERAKLEMEVNKRLEVIQSAEVLSAEYQNVEVKSGEVTVKKASVSENDYKEEKSHLIQLPDKIEVKAERNAVQDDIKVAMTVSETQVLEKSKDVQSVICMPKNAKLKEGTGNVKEAYAVEETQTIEKTQSLQKSKDAQSEVYKPKNAIVKDVKDEETSEVKVAVSVEETQTSEKASEVQCGAIKAHAELKDVKDEETEEVKVAVTVQDIQFEEKTSEVSSEVIKAHAEIKDVKDGETEEVKVAVTVVELQTEGKTSEAKSGEESKQVEEPLTVQVSSDEVISKVEAAKTEGDQQANPSDSKASDEPDTELMESAILQAGVADIASRLEGIRCALESVIVNYPPPGSSAPSTPSTSSLKTTTASPVPPPPHSTPILSPTPLSIDTQPATAQTISTNLQVHTSTSLCPSSPILHRAASPLHNTPTSYISYMHSIAASIQSTAGNLQCEGYESPVSSPEPPRSPSPPLAIYHSSSAHALEALDKSCKTFNDALEALEDPSLLDDESPPTVSYKPPSILHLLSPSSSQTSVVTVQSSNSQPTPTDKIQLSAITKSQTETHLPISKTNIAENSLSSKLSTETSITDKLISELQAQKPPITDFLLTTSPDKVSQEFSPHFTLSQELTIEQPLLKEVQKINTSVNEPIKAQSVQIQQTSVESTSAIQSHIKETSLEQPQIQQTSVEPPLTIQSHVKETSSEQSQIQLTSVDPSSTVQSHIKETTLEQSKIQQTSVEPSSTVQSHIKETTLEQSKIQQTSIEPSTTVKSQIKETTLEQSQIQETSVEPLSAGQAHLKNTSLEQSQIPKASVESHSIVQSHIKETSTEKSQIQETSVEPPLKIQSHVKETSLEQSQIQKTIVEPSTTQSSINTSKSQKNTQKEPPTTQEPTMKKSPSTSRFGLTVSPSSENLLPWGYLGPARPPSPTEIPSISSPLLSPEAPVKRVTSPIFGFTKVDPDSNNIPWQYLGPTTSSSSLQDLEYPIPVHDSLQSSSFSTVTNASKSIIGESKTQLESSCSIPIPISHSSTTATHFHSSPVSSSTVTFGSPFPPSSPKPTARYTFGLPSVNSAQDLQSITSLQKDSSTMSEVSSSTTASQQNKTEPEC